MNLYSIGTDVFVDGLPGKIVCIKIAYEQVTYDIGYWLHGEYKCVSLYDFEFDVSDNHGVMTIGFK